MLRNFRSAGLRPTDVMRKSNNLEKDLRSLGIRVVNKPEHDRQHQIDEEALREALEKNVPYSRPQQVLRDIDSISAIVRLRKGESFARVEECRAVFVTTNSTLARFASRYFSEGAGARAVTPCLTDYALTNILWLKRPTAAPDLPRKRIIADCYAATRPTEELWRRYLQEIERLEREGEVSADEYYMLRHSTLAESALVDATMGQEEGFTEGTAAEVLDRVRSNIEAKKQAEVNSERSAREAAEREIQAGQERTVSRQKAIWRNAQTGARWITRGLTLLALGLLVLATAYSFPWDLPAPSALWWRYLITVALGLLLVLSVASLVRGTTLLSASRRMEASLSRWIERRLLALTGEED